jgi:hypothetical protein
MTELIISVIEPVKRRGRPTGQKTDHIIKRILLYTKQK